MKHYVASLLTLLTCIGCSNAEAPAQVGTQTPSDASEAAAIADEGAMTNAPGLPGRTEELTQPDEAAMVFLYHDLAQIPLPLDAVIERDSRVAMARAADKATMRDQVRSELAAGLSAVARVGWLRMPLNANLSDYDPSYQEFTVRAFSPSSFFSFQAFGEKVELKFRNAREAQTWRVTAEEAQSVRDKLSYYGATADVLLKIVGVQPAPGGGVILADVMEYDIRSKRNDQRIGRVTVAQ